MTLNDGARDLPLWQPTTRASLSLPKPIAALSPLSIASGLLIVCVATTPFIAMTPFASTWGYNHWLGAAAMGCLVGGFALSGLLLFQHTVMDEHEMQFIGAGLVAIVSSSVVVAMFAAQVTSSEQHAAWLIHGRLGLAIVGVATIIAATMPYTSRLRSLVQVGLTIAASAAVLGVIFAIWQPPSVVSGLGLASLALIAAAIELKRHRQSQFADHGWIAFALCGVAAAEALITIQHDNMVYVIGASAVTGIGFIYAHKSIRSSLVTRLRSDLTAVDALLETQRQLREQQRCQERALAQLAHDNRSTALALESAVELISNSEHAPVEMIALSSALGDEVGRMRRTVADIVAGAAPVQTHVVWDAIESVVRCRSAQVRDLRVDVTDGVRAHSDPDTLASVVDALMANAVEHGGAGLVSVSVTSTANTAIISVDDDGPGVVDVCREIIFERGVTSKRDDHQGLGLFGAAERARTVGASILVKSSVHGGARFEVHVPMTSTPSFVPMADARSGR
ncbi:MAG: HAMP domain-containing histidine kinase [Acidobacteria bacterium]|nr:HAMP domain-containing histidine kinase [Acidobacteriota bacterium]